MVFYFTLCSGNVVRSARLVVISNGSVTTISRSHHAKRNEATSTAATAPALQPKHAADAFTVCTAPGHSTLNDFTFPRKTF